MISDVDLWVIEYWHFNGYVTCSQTGEALPIFGKSRSGDLNPMTPIPMKKIMKIVHTLWMDTGRTFQLRNVKNGDILPGDLL